MCSSHAAVDAGICYKRSSDDGASWGEIQQVKVGVTQPTVVCVGKSLILQYNVSHQLLSFVDVCRL